MKPSPIKLIGGHLDSPPTWADPIIYATGLAGMHWARLEQNLDALLISVNKPQFEPRRYLPTPNTSFKLKIRIFREWFVKDPRFAKHHDLAAVLARSFRKLAADRVLLTHSNVQEFIEGPPLRMVAINLHIDGDTLRQNRGEWTVEQITGATNGIQRANTGLNLIGRDVLKPEFLRSLEGSG